MSLLSGTCFQLHRKWTFPEVLNSPLFPSSFYLSLPPLSWWLIPPPYPGFSSFLPVPYPIRVTSSPFLPGNLHTHFSHVGNHFPATLAPQTTSLSPCFTIKPLDKVASWSYFQILASNSFFNALPWSVTFYKLFQRFAPKWQFPKCSTVLSYVLTKSSCSFLYRISCQTNPHYLFSIIITGTTFSHSMQNSVFSPSPHMAS